MLGIQLGFGIGLVIGAIVCYAIFNSGIIEDIAEWINKDPND